MPPRFGRDQVRAILTSIASPPPSEHLGRSDLGGAIDRVDRLSRRRGFVCVIADFAGEGWADPLIRLGMRNDLLAIPIHDPRERDVPPVGLVSLVDAATGAQPRGPRHRRRAAALRRGRRGAGRAATRRPAPGRCRRHRAAHGQRLARRDHPARPPPPGPGRQRPGAAPMSPNGIARNGLRGRGTHDVSRAAAAVAARRRRRPGGRLRRRAALAPRRHAALHHGRSARRDRAAPAAVAPPCRRRPAVARPVRRRDRHRQTDHHDDGAHRQ